MKFLDIGPGNAFSDMSPKAQGSKAQTSGRKQTKKLMHSKGNKQQSEMAT